MSEKDFQILPPEMRPNPYGSGIKDHDVTVSHQTRTPYTVAKLAMSLVERWGLVACETDGEDTGGRQKLRRMAPAELVQTACDTAALLWQELEKRDWLLEIPLPVKRAKKETEDA